MDNRDETTWATLELTKPGELKAIEGKLCNSLLLKVNQIGSVSEAMQACQMARFSMRPNSSSSEPWMNSPTNENGKRSRRIFSCTAVQTEG